MSATYSASYSSTYTEARARKVMMKVTTDLTVICNSGFLKNETKDYWEKSILYCMDKEALQSFELQFEPPNSLKRGLRYILSDDGSLIEDSKAGGIDYGNLPDGTKVNIVITLKDSRRNMVIDQLQNWGWGSNGEYLKANASRDLAYSKDGYGLERQKVGDWEP
jgi:hypothetical protein